MAETYVLEGGLVLGMLVIIPRLALKVFMQYIFEALKYQDYIIKYYSI